jgi:hypothetical protein
MAMKFKKLFPVIIMLLTGCSSLMPVSDSLNIMPASGEIKTPAQEFSFSTKALTKSYLKRKLEKILCLGENTGSNCSVNGTNLVKLLNYSRFKYPETFCQTISENPFLLNLVYNTPEVKDRELKDQVFDNFLLSCLPTTSEAQAYSKGCWDKAAVNNNQLDFSTDSTLAGSVFYTGSPEKESICSCYAFQVQNAGSCDINTAYDACLTGLGSTWDPGLTTAGINFDGTCAGS